MTIYFITQQFKARRMVYDENQNVLWLDPNFKEKFLKRLQVGFNLKLLRAIDEYPALSGRVTANTRLVYFTLHLKDMKMAVGVDEDGLGFLNRLTIPDPPSIDGKPMVQRSLN